jgi:alkylation response protein AidB-like acyl-CoA dehydrogenase
MRFALTEDQQELRAVVRAFLDRHAGSAQVRALIDAPERAHEPWRRLTGELELTALAIPVEHGGAGASFVEVAVAIEELGRTLLPVPYLPTVAAAAAITDAHGASADDHERGGAGALLERIASGATAAIAFAPGATSDGRVVAGEADHVLGGDLAEILVVVAAIDGEPALLAVDAEGPAVSRTRLPTLDQARGQAHVAFGGAPAVVLTGPSDGARAVERATDVLRAALAVESIGAADRCLEMTVAYLKERRQFGRVLGSFQALRHRCADLAAELEGARSTAWYAAWAVDGAPAELPVVGPLAKAVCADAYLHVAAETIQLHGGIGFTWEHDAHLHLKRAKSTQLLLGDSRRLRRLAAERAGALAG